MIDFELISIDFKSRNWKLIDFFFLHQKNRLAEIDPKLRAQQRMQEVCARFQGLHQMSQHIFQEYTYKKITPCDVCGQILRGKYLNEVAVYATDSICRL